MGGLKLSEIKKHVMTGISFMIPIVVGAGLCMALGTAIGGTKVSGYPDMVHLENR